MVFGSTALLPTSGWLQVPAERTAARQKQQQLLKNKYIKPLRADAAMADAEISDYAAEAETFAERVDWARGGSSPPRSRNSRPCLRPRRPRRAPTPSALVRLLAKNDCGPEAAQRAEKLYLDSPTPRSMFRGHKKRAPVP